MIKYIDKGTARQHLTDRLIESALNNAGFREDADAVFLDIAKNRLPVWLDELETYEVAEVKRGHWIVDRKFGNDVMSGEQMVICSVCGKGIMWGKQKYCPNCGARMVDLDEVEE